ncbi:GNAT family N-acetyltransferase [Vibrio parahaemolyticus]|uniref:GNAT family N-acetyltransferase n=1 Tax=Vibrio parahaemolyticus TaxID=670 RepID=UPI001E3F79CF|nr:GNAT family N-acetyltransferase [Vibrio parahaemolyticus]
MRVAQKQDSATILRFVKELARYEHLEHEVKASVEDVDRAIFDEDSTTHAVICYVNEEPIGFAVYFFNYSTWLGKNGLYLEDLYVSSEYRNVGAGKALLKHLANIAVDRGCGRFEWAVLDWNQPAIDFYQSIGAELKMNGRSIDWREMHCSALLKDDVNGRFDVSTRLSREWLASALFRLRKGLN